MSYIFYININIYKYIQLLLEQYNYNLIKNIFIICSLKLQRSYETFNATDHECDIDVRCGGI